MRLAIVHDFLNQYGGAERVLERMHELWPDAPVYTSMYDPRAMPSAYRRWDIRTSFMQRFPWVTRRHQQFLLFYPSAFESFDLSSFDVVLSNSSAFCKGVVTGPQTVHICYCLTPMRFAWNYHEYVERERLGGLLRGILPLVMTGLRAWDVTTSQRVDHFIAISQAVADRIRKYYRRDSAIIYPPVDTDAFTPSDEVDDYYLVVSRLIPYKRIDVAVDAFNQLGLPLWIVGDGRDRGALERRARSNIRFLGRLPDAEVKRLIARCRAFIFPGEEDFGITPLEAQAAGRPVIAYAGGGALETVVEGETGVFFHPQTPEALVEAVRRFDALAVKGESLRRHAARFGVAVFKQQLASFVERAYAEHQARRTRQPAAGVS